MKRKIYLFIVSLSILICPLLKASFVEFPLESYPCIYLDRETIHRIQDKEISNIVILGSSNGFDAIRISNYYKSSVFIFEDDPEKIAVINKNIVPYPQVFLESSSLHSLKEWMQEKKINNIDLLCISSQIDLEDFKRCEEQLRDTKYIILCKDVLIEEEKKYLIDLGFSSFFEGFSLFNAVLFVGKLYQFNELKLIDFNKLTLDSRIDNDENSKLMYWLC